MMGSEHPRSDDWRTQAACRGQDISLFFPGQGGPFTPAKRFCDACPVRRPCLEDDLAVVKATQIRTYGIRGGLTAVGRKHLLDGGDVVLEPYTDRNKETRR